MQLATTSAPLCDLIGATLRGWGRSRDPVVRFRGAAAGPIAKAVFAGLGAPGKAVWMKLVREPYGGGEGRRRRYTSPVTNFAMAVPLFVTVCAESRVVALT